MPCLSKIFEKLLLNHVKQQLLSYNAIPMHQFCFRENHSLTLLLFPLPALLSPRQTNRSLLQWTTKPRLSRIKEPQNEAHIRACSLPRYLLPSYTKINLTPKTTKLNTPKIAYLQQSIII